MDTTGSRLKQARLAKKMTQEAAARAAGVTKQAVSAIELGKAKKPSSPVLDALCDVYGIDSGWALLRKPGALKNTESSDDDWPDVLGHKVVASLGAGAIPDEYAETHKLKFRAESLRRKRLKPESLGVVYGKGDSMLPRIHDGDAILFDRTDTTPRDGHLYVVSYEGDLLAKALVLLGGRWFIQSLNRDDHAFGKPRPIDEYKHFAIHGRVRWIGSWVD